MKFNKNYKYFLKDLSSLIFTTKLIAFSHTPETDFHSLIESITSNPNLIVDETNMIRILVPLFGVLSKDSVIDIFNVMKDNIWPIINHKFGIYLIQKLIERNINHYQSYIAKLHQAKLAK